MSFYEARQKAEEDFVKDNIEEINAVVEKAREVLEFDPENIAVLHNFPVPENMQVFPVWVDGYVFVLSKSGNLYGWVNDEYYSLVARPSDMLELNEHIPEADKHAVQVDISRSLHMIYDLYVDQIVRTAGVDEARKIVQMHAEGKFLHI